MHRPTHCLGAGVECGVLLTDPPDPLSARLPDLTANGTTTQPMAPAHLARFHKPTNCLDPALNV